MGEAKRLRDGSNCFVGFDSAKGSASEEWADSGAPVVLGGMGARATTDAEPSEQRCTPNRSSIKTSLCTSHSRKPCMQVGGERSTFTRWGLACGLLPFLRHTTTITMARQITSRRIARTCLRSRARRKVSGLLAVTALPWSC